MDAAQIKNEHPSDMPACECKPRVRPRIHPFVRRFLDDKGLVFSLIEGLGSPLNVIFPQLVEENIVSFQAAYKKNHMRGRIYFTTKPCKSQAIWRQAALQGIGADVSSENSLKAAISAGFTPDRIGATGPKSVGYILIAMQLDVLIAVDSIAELKTIIALRSKLGLKRKTRILVRLSGFTSTRMKFTPQDNSFGIDVKDMSFVFDLLEQSKDDLDFQGFSFYLRTANEEQRIVAFENQMSLTFEAIRRGFQIRTVNIGGGFSIAYADDRAEWNAYIERLKEAALHKIESQTWNNTGLGFSMQDGFLKGAPIFNDHCPARTKGEELDHWLSLRLPDHGNAAFGDLVRDSLLELAIEPGMGMLDQCGVTLGDVNFIKESTWGEKIIGLKMNRSNLHSTHQKILTEPVILMRDPLNNPVDERGVYYLGNLCLSYDILRDNRTYPERTPMQGDVVAFMNTAAYGMDFIESESLMQPTAQKVALYEREGAMRWALDENYMPVNLPMGGAL